MSKAQLSKGGNLSIWRKDKYQQCYCFRVEPGCECGQWCPAFGEPEKTADGTTVLDICTRRLEFDVFEDER